MSDTDKDKIIAMLRADLVREQRPWTVKLSIETMDGCEVCDCTVSDIGHADHILLVTCDDVERLQKQVAVLQAEVKAWRDWDDNCGVELNADNIEACSCEGVNRVENVLNAKKATDSANALEKQ